MAWDHLLCPKKAGFLTASIHHVCSLRKQEVNLTARISQSAFVSKNFQYDAMQSFALKHVHSVRMIHVMFSNQTGNIIYRERKSMINCQLSFLVFMILGIAYIVREGNATCCRLPQINCLPTYLLT